MESSSRIIKTKGSDILQARIFGRGILPSASLMICRSVPSAKEKTVSMACTRVTKINHTRFKNSDCIRHNMENGSPLKEWSSTDGGPRYSSNDGNVIFCSGSNLIKPAINIETIAQIKECTREKPGDGLASVLKSKVSFSAWKGFIGFS